MHRVGAGNIFLAVSLCCLVFLPQDGNAFVGRSGSGSGSPPRGPNSHLNHNPFDGDGGSGGGDSQGFSKPVYYDTNPNENDIDEDEEAFLATGLDASSSAGVLLAARGGSSKQKKKDNDIVKGGQVLFVKMGNFWKATVGSARQKVSNTFNFKSKEEKTQEELVQQLRTMPVRAVTVPESTVLPPDVVRLAVKRSGMIGSPLRTDRVQDIARNLKRWYVRQGYILHSVTGATLKPETATAEITVEEPRTSKVPVSITTVKEMIVDSSDSDGQADGAEPELLTLRQYREKHAARKSFRHDRIEKKDLNTTFVSAPGRTKASRIAKALKLVPGKPFCWDGSRWQRIASSGIFAKILQTSPVRLPDGTVQVQVYATEPPPRHLEYGLGKSMYSGSWEGEIDFEHQNLFGGGETIGVTMRRGTKDAEPSVRVRYSDERFGLEGGYDVEVFSDYIGDAPGGSSMNGDHEDSAVSRKEADRLHPLQQDDEDALLDRRGTTFRLRNPIDPKYIRHSLASASLERTSTTTGLHESIASSSWTLGPFRKNLPMDARSSISTTVTGGTRIVGQGKEGTEKTCSVGNAHLMPYSSISATTRQILPLSIASPKDQGNNRTPQLALQHTIATSTSGLPRHEAKALGIGAQIRGASPDGRAMSTVKGTVELRIPVSLPHAGDCKAIVFGDWFYTQKDLNSPFNAKSSIGIGFRKSISGLPLKLDVCYSSEGKAKTMFGLGPDFDA